jgi:hypothetical protein
VFSDNLKKIWRLEGLPEVAGFGTATSFFDFTNTVSFPAFNYFSTSSKISQIVSMEYYGLFVNKIMTKNANGTLLMANPTAGTHTYAASGLLYNKNFLTDPTKTLGIRERADVVTACPTATQFKFAQT